MGDLIEQPEYINRYVSDEEAAKTKGIVFRAKFVNGDVFTVRSEQFLIFALHDLIQLYREKHPDCKPEDLYMEQVRYHNGTQWIYVLKDTRFTLGVV